FGWLIYGGLQNKRPAYFLMKYSAGVKAPPHIHSGDYYAVVVSGSFRHFLESENEYKVMTAEETWFQRVSGGQQDACAAQEACILSIFWPHGFDVEFAEKK